MADTDNDKSEVQEPTTSRSEVEDDQPSPPSAELSALGVEPDEPPSKAILAMLAGLAVIVVVAAAGLWQVFGLTSIAEIEVKDLKVDNKELLELRARDWGRLTQYEALDAGTYQVPIERAMKKLVDEPSLIAPLVLPKVEDAGAPDAEISDAESDAAATQNDGEASKESDSPVAPASAPPATSTPPASSEARP